MNCSHLKLNKQYTMYKIKIIVIFWVQYVNKNEVSDKEQLSDRAYILDI